MWWLLKIWKLRMKHLHRGAASRQWGSFLNRLIQELKQGSSFQDLQTSNVHVKDFSHRSLSFLHTNKPELAPSVHTDPENCQRLFMRSVICSYSGVINTITPLQSKSSCISELTETSSRIQHCMCLKLHKHGGSSTFAFLTPNNTEPQHDSSCCHQHVSVVKTQLG